MFILFFKRRNRFSRSRESDPKVCGGTKQCQAAPQPRQPTPTFGPHTTILWPYGLIGTFCCLDPFASLMSQSPSPRHSTRGTEVLWESQENGDLDSYVVFCPVSSGLRYVAGCPFVGNILRKQTGIAAAREYSQTESPHELTRS